MTNFAILARIKAKQLQAQPIVEPKQKHKEDLGKIAMNDPETNETVKEFESIEQAVEEGFSMPQVVKAIKHGNKYKGHLWSAENELT